MNFTYALLQLLIPLLMPLLHVFLPKVLALEQLGTFRNFAAPLRLILLLDEAIKLVFDRFIFRLYTKLLDVDAFRFEKL